MFKSSYLPMNLKIMLLTVRTSFYCAVQECVKVVTVKKLL